jgi:glycosyltransferase involved in cell wall biosynthesis
MIESDAGIRTEQAPLVSVIMPSFNSERTILRAMRSVLAQTYRNFEVIIADDASKDATAQQVASLNDPRICFIPSNETVNRGPAAARNRALARARGTYIAFLDSDDEWLPEKLAKQVAFLEAHPQHSLVVSNASDISPQGDVIEAEFDSSPPVSGPDAWRVLLKYSFIETSSVMTRRALVEELGGFDPALFVSQDQDLWIRLALRGEVGIIDTVLGKIHQVPSGHMSRNKHRQAEIMLPMIEKHIARLDGKLSRREIDDILGHRYQIVGRTLFLHGYYGLGLKLMAQASARNGNWAGNLFFLCHANPIGIALKRALKGMIGAHPAAA